MTQSHKPQQDSPALPGKHGFLGPDRWWHLSFGTLMAVTLAVFMTWSFSYVDPGANKAVLVLTILFGLFMAFNIGGNDVANSFGTSVGAGTLTMKQALIVAAIFEVSGAVLAGGEVTETVRSGIVDLNAIDLAPMDFVFIMMSALLGAAIWLLVATRMGWPVSTTHSIVGGIVGAALALGFATGTGGFEMVQWSEIGKIVLSWVLSPLLGGIVAWVLFGQIKKHILVYNEQMDVKLRELRRERAELRTRHKKAFERLDELQKISYTNAMARDASVYQREDLDPEELESEYYRDLHSVETRAREVQAHRALETWVPLLAAFGAVVIGSMMLFKGLKNLNFELSSVGNFLILGMIAATVWMAVFIFARSLKKHDLSRSTFVLFSWMQVFTASAFAFSHGSNDIANAIGPFAAILDVLKTGQVNDEAGVPPAVMLTAGVALIVGLWFIGRFVIKTVGSGLTEMHPASGFAAELAAAGIVMLASVMGLPVSSTHILIGAVLGVGIVNKAANWKLMKPIALAWVITVPVAALLGAGGVLVLRAIFGA
ncbi:inorganic phosphate transporter [Pseudoglutamicibacter cumminsii]|uniref:inorganic phosphate transporter n=1 Tax=Pseudoglutamicibacter cumminsii TaxID=156979 RepID=UPI0021A7B3D5|nr:inorganic phosphate transporter [Pseudoglutamicibacter cumminsii]MCT1685614.1 inorganic phosphate transporter [Pseudoglutamicibacter cumminsii]